MSMGTIRKAQQQLVSEGLAISKGAPKGYIVRQTPERLVYQPQQELRGPGLNRVKTTEHFVEDVKKSHRIPSQEITVSVQEAPQPVQERLSSTNEPTIVVVRKRIRYINSLPLNVTYSYYPLSIVQGSKILKPEDIPEGVSSVLENLGYHQVSAIDHWIARVPTTDESNELEIPAGTAILEQILTSYTEEGIPVRCTIVILPGDRHTVEYKRNWGSDTC